MFGKIKKIHFVGIGGIGMSGIAEVLHNLGFIVTGSDTARNSTVERLSNLGIEVIQGHSADNVGGADLVVYSSAVRLDNPELVRAKDNYIPVIKRAEMLAELMRMKYSIVVAGSHGKTTTTSMIGEILYYADFDPTVVIGGRLNRDYNNALVGKSEFMVSEADESDRSFLMLYPTVSVITNIDLEHLDAYEDMDDLKNAFIRFANKVPFYGVNIICIDDLNVTDIIPYIEKRFTTYGLSAKADVSCYDIKRTGFSVSFEVLLHGEKIGRVKLALPGEHNVLNALASIAVGFELEIPFDRIKKGLENFQGVQRRLTLRLDSDNVKVIDDYGHHPTEISTTLRAVREAFPNYRVVAVFQPHRYSRTSALMTDFAKCFFDADELYVTDIYAASEDPIENVNSERLVAEIKKHGFKDVLYIEKLSDFLQYIDNYKNRKTVFLTLGAGDITNFSSELAKALEDK
ncbi:UDP-N-acetylmuramate--L-alanine ligase [Flexistipes sinusarabici DSM 4947]|uniref:UDP-N-acetylmuramate--L-alanine ligase n=1 Tax=Flexistipes sinusarabici (strain ATCC 49648 / DSM 4947 / MAS 10) TaxID=717231 RepID=F8E9J6_FLESM|nr:UDP-N-acetylmuramate--L-alanine ligase [Flexistipes sinusarabici]AEI15325.1 UDP-N-acetylmuramate--L-alanine ligase [Flexistipes sinusarabici DSM 4947]